MAPSAAATAVSPHTSEAKVCIDCGVAKPCARTPNPSPGRRLALFHMDDDIDRLRAAIKYLEESGC